MNNEEQTQPTTSSDQKGQKPERIDELDVIGGALLKLVRNGFEKVKGILAPRKVE